MKKVLLMLCSGVELYEAGSFYDVLGWSGAEGFEPVSVTTTGFHAQIRCTFGQMLIPDKLLSEIDPAGYDALAIPGGFEEYGFYEEAYSPEMDKLIARFDRDRKPIAAICVGALAVAHAGALKGLPGTTYHLGNGRRRKQLSGFGVEVVDAPIVRSGHIITSSSPGTAIAVAFQLLSQLIDPSDAEKIRHLMGFDVKIAFEAAE